jgi:hypothetical protein
MFFPGSNIRSSAPSSPGAGPKRGRRPRGCRLSDTEEQTNISSYSQSNRQNKYNFHVDLGINKSIINDFESLYNLQCFSDPLLDGTARINLLTNQLAELRKVYHSLKAELATIDRRRKKLRRKEREGISFMKFALHKPF